MANKQTASHVHKTCSFNLNLNSIYFVPGIKAKMSSCGISVSIWDQTHTVILNHDII